MESRSMIEATLGRALQEAVGPSTPPRLAAAMRHAVFPGGARVRPRLTLAVAAACGQDNPGLAAAAAAAIELLHCASLVHDDMPEFDNAPTRRGRPSVHAAHGCALALLTGDALIVLAFETIAAAAAPHQARLPSVLAAIGRGVGAAHGITAGQAWESEEHPDLGTYQRAKTGALFAAAAEAGAAAAGRPSPAWRTVGLALGEAYQVADDIADALGNAATLGKPIGQDGALGRPNAVQLLGLPGATDRLTALADRAAGAVPACRGRNDLRNLIVMESRRLLPKELFARAA